MTLSPADIESLSTSLAWWEFAEYVCAGLVTLACFGEYVADFKDWFTAGIKERKERLAKISTLLLIAALSAELICLVRTNQLSGKLIGSLNAEAGEADRKARVATEKAGQATTKADAATDASSKALDNSDRANADASSALHLAQGARKEADSFEKDISSAKKQATEAEAHLAEALHGTAEAMAALNRLKSARSISNASTLVSNLEAFKDTEYTFSSVFADQESIELLKELDSVLQRAGWKRTKPPGGYPAINVYGKDVDLAVPSSLTTGVNVSVDSLEALAVLQSRPPDKLPQLIRAAIALNLGLYSSLAPTQDTLNKPVDVEPGSSTVIRIAVGKKP